MNSSLCSIIIPTYNHGKYIERSVESALSQTYKNVEVIVIDDGSIDDTSERIKKYGSSIIYHKKVNGGLGAARNTGIQISKGEYLQFLDADDFIDSNKIEQQIKVFNKDSSLSVVYSDCSCTEASGDAIENTSYPLKSQEEPLSVLIKRTLFPVHAGLIKRSAVIDAGAFDESRFAQEDWDLWLRVALRGGKFKYLPGNSAHYDQQGSTMVSNPLLMFKRTRHLMEKLLGDPLFKESGKAYIDKFIMHQSLLLAKRAYNNAWWKQSRKYFTKAIMAKPGQVPLKYWLCVPKSFLHSLSNKIKGRKTIVPEV